MNNRYQLFTLSVGLAFLLFTGTSYGLTPKERQLVEGLNAINADLRAQVADNESKITQKDTDYLFLKSKNDALAANLENSRAMEAQQTADLTTAQGKVKALESDRDAQQARANKAELNALKFQRQAHVKSVVIDVTLGIIALAVTVLVGMCSGQILGWAAKVYPPSAAFGMLIEIGLLVGTPLIVFGFLKGVLAVVESRL